MMKTFKTFFATAAVAAGALLFSATNTMAQNTPQLTDPEIASVAVTANQIDVNYGKIALQKARSKQVREFAQNMINDHSNIIKAAVALAQKLHVTPKDNAVTKSLLKQSRATTQMLRSKKGKDFDKAYINNEVAYHKAVIKAVEDVLLPQTQNAQLKAFIKSAVPVLKTHLAHAEKVQRELK